VLTRYRLRFLLQEIDLPQGETLIGRSASCQVTIEDPLVSRQHARLMITGSQASLEDLGSRNGSFVNGRPVSGAVEVHDGDRLRIGTQELVLCSVQAPSRQAKAGTRPTGFMCHCSSCGQPYPAELLECPNCGSTERLDEDTISGFVGAESQRNWTLALLVDVLERAVLLERWDDVERILRRAKPTVEERLDSGHALLREQVDGLAAAAARLAESRQQAEWGRWALSVHATLGFVPRRDIIERLSTLPPAERASLAPVAHQVLESVNARGEVTAEDRSGLVRVESLGSTPGGDGG
jgi:hypothetical protein